MQSKTKSPTTRCREKGLQKNEVTEVSNLRSGHLIFLLGQLDTETRI